MNWLKKVFSFIGRTVILPTLESFLQRYLELGKDVVLQLITTYPNVPFHTIKDQAFQRLKEVTGQQKDTWISILVDLAYESLRATRATSQKSPW